MEKANMPRGARMRRLYIKYLLIVLGGIVYAIGFQYFMFPNNIVSGGVTGIAMILNHFTRWPVGMTVLVMNVPLFLIAWRHFGMDYLIGSLVGTAVSSVCVDLFASTGIVATTDPMLGSIIGGVIKGAGLGMIYYVGASTGGIDNSSLCYIVSEKSEELVREIISGHVHRGVTILEGEGAYSHQTKHVIMCVIKRTQMGEMRRLVRQVDERAFFIVTDAKTVFGNGFENISEVR